MLLNVGSGGGAPAAPTAGGAAAATGGAAAAEEAPKEEAKEEGSSSPLSYFSQHVLTWSSQRKRNPTRIWASVFSIKLLIFKCLLQIQFSRVLRPEDCSIQSCNRWCKSVRHEMKWTGTTRHNQHCNGPGRATASSDSVDLRPIVESRTSALNAFIDPTRRFFYHTFATSGMPLSYLVNAWMVLFPLSDAPARFPRTPSSASILTPAPPSELVVPIPPRLALVSTLCHSRNQHCFLSVRKHLIPVSLLILDDARVIRFSKCAGKVQRVLFCAGASFAFALD